MRGMGEAGGDPGTAAALLSFGDTEGVFRTRVSEPGMRRSYGKRLLGFVCWRGHTSPRFSSWQSGEQIGAVEANPKGLFD